MTQPKCFAITVLVISILTALASTSLAQGNKCMAVTGVPQSRLANFSFTAQISVSDCVPQGTVFMNVSLTVQSSNQAVIPQPAAVTFSPQGQASVPLSVLQVSICTPVDLTFSALVNNQTITVSKRTTVCQFAFDLQTTGVSVTNQQMAGQDSQIAVTVVNQGTETLSANSYHLELKTVEAMADLSRRNCLAPTSSEPVRLDPIEELRPGVDTVIHTPFPFPQGGNITLTAKIFIGGGEEGPQENNTRSVVANVPLPPPALCAVSPTTAVKTGDTITVRGNWFHKIGTNDTPIVMIGNRPATAINVASPLEMTVSLPEVDCTVGGQAHITVNNGSGSASLAAGPALAPLEIADLSTDNSPAGLAQNITINLTNFRQGCNVTVTLEPWVFAGQTFAAATVTPQILSRTANSVVIRIYATGMWRRLYMIYTLKVATPYGAASLKGFSRGPKRQLPDLVFIPH